MKAQTQHYGVVKSTTSVATAQILACRYISSRLVANH